MMDESRPSLVNITISINKSSIGTGIIFLTSCYEMCAKVVPRWRAPLFCDPSYERLCHASAVAPILLCEGAMYARDTNSRRKIYPIVRLDCRCFCLV